MDEPTTGLDPLMREAFLELIREEKQKGHTIFMSSHIFEEIESVCDRVAMIKDGHLIATTSLYDLRHPAIKDFIIEFEQIPQKQQFIETAPFSAAGTDANACTVQCSVEQLDTLFNMLKNYQIINLQEIHLSLQQQFMRAYKEGLTQNGNK